MLFKKLSKVLFCILIGNANSYGDQQALSVYQEAQQKTSTLKGYVAEYQKTDTKTGRLLTQTSTIKRLDSGVVLQRIETISNNPSNLSQKSRPAFIMLSNEAGIYYYFPTQNKAIKVLFLPKMTNSINSTLAGLPKVIPSNDQISLHDEIINGKSRTVAQLILSDQQKSNYLLALQGSLQSLGSGQDAINENLTSVSGIKYYIDKDSGLLLGQRLINSHNQEVFGLVYSSMTPAEPSDDQFEFPKTTLTYNANSPEELSDLMFKIILDE